jgi:CO/xanthine dehydrogenase FAD-binding subunit
VPGAVAFAGMGPAPARLEVSDRDELRALIHERLEPEDDLHASARYRRWLAERLAARALGAL